MQEEDIDVKNCLFMCSRRTLDVAMLPALDGSNLSSFYTHANDRLSCRTVMPGILGGNLPWNKQGHRYWEYRGIITPSGSFSPAVNFDTFRPGWLNGLSQEKKNNFISSLFPINLQYEF